MNPLTLSRVVAVLAVVGAGVTAFSGAVTSGGGYKAAAIAAFAAIVAAWMHEEHSTARAAIGPPAPSGDLNAHSGPVGPDVPATAAAAPLGAPGAGSSTSGPPT